MHNRNSIVVPQRVARPSAGSVRLRSRVYGSFVLTDAPRHPQDKSARDGAARRGQMVTEGHGKNRDDHLSNTNSTMFTPEGGHRAVHRPRPMFRGAGGPGAGGVSNMMMAAWMLSTRLPELREPATIPEQYVLPRGVSAFFISAMAFVCQKAEGHAAH